jgi:hypothetical protein
MPPPSADSQLPNPLVGEASCSQVHSDAQLGCRSPDMRSNIAGSTEPELLAMDKPGGQRLANEQTASEPGA